jgi:hypothetical protein
VAFAVAIFSVLVLLEFLVEHFVHVYVWAGESGCIKNVEYHVDEFFGYFFLAFAFLPSVACFSEFYEGEEKFLGNVFWFVVESFFFDERFYLFLHFFEVQEFFLLFVHSGFLF